MTDGNSGGNVRASNLDVIATIQRMEISMTERFARLETSYGYVAERLGKIEAQYEGMRDALKSIEGTQATANAGLKELQTTYAELERDIHMRTQDFEARIRQLEKQVWQTATALSLGAVILSVIVERVVIPVMLR